MLKKELIWRELLTRNEKITQQDLAKKLSFSLSTIFNALKVPRRIGALAVNGKGVFMRDKTKLITLWATVRRLKNDVVYQTHSPLSILETEKSMPAGVIWTAYSAFRLKYPEEPVPASYGKIYIYASKNVLQDIKKRFPPNKKEANLFILKPDKNLEKYGPIAPEEQILVDLWNIEDWQASEFYKALIDKI